MSEPFRQSAVNRALSPERLDESITIVPTRSWLLLSGLGIVCLVAIGWSLLGSVTTRVYGQAIIVSEGSFTHAVQPLVAGRVTEVVVAPGAKVRTGEVLARLSVPSLVQELRAAEELLAILREEHQQLLARQVASTLARDRLFSQQEDALQRQLADAERLARNGEAQLEELVGPAGRDPAAADDIGDARARVDAAHSTAFQARVELAAVAVERAKAGGEDADRLDQLSEQLTEQRGKVDILRDRFDDATEIASPIDGIVQEIGVRPGAIVTEGQAIMTVRTHSDGFEALSFLPAVQGNLVVPGMAAQLAPNGVKEEEFGSIRGMVRSVSDHPVSRRAAMELLQNEELVAAFFEEGPPIAARVALEAKPGSVSGFAWSAGKGPSFPVTLGTLGSVSVTVHEQPPVTLLLPSLRQLTGSY